MSHDGKDRRESGMLHRLWERRALWATVTGVALWGGWLISMLAGPRLFDLAGQPIGTDWVVFHAAGSTVTASEEAHLYDLAWQHAL